LGDKLLQTINNKLQESQWHTVYDATEVLTGSKIVLENAETTLSASYRPKVVNCTKKSYISIIDVIEVLTGSNRPRKYWDDLKRKLKVEGSELSEKIGRLSIS
jgi:hypothetical protein